MMLVERFKKAWKAFFIIEKPPLDSHLYISDDDRRDYSDDDLIKKAHDRTFQRNSKQDWSKEMKYAMDSADTECNGIETGFQFFQNTTSPLLLSWYAQQSFIGYQLAEIMAQHWLIEKACTMPALDASRNGYTVTVNDGQTDVKAQVLDAIKQADKKFRINYHLVEAVHKNRIFGVRIIMFKIEYPGQDPKYYEKPFNIDGVKPGSYKGIVQVDPYWITPELDMAAAADPASMFFYEPTWWQINGRRVHRTHLVILRNGEVGDILKPTYFYGGISVPQKMYERVYAAERTANEAPLLALSKRTAVISTDTSAAILKPGKLIQRMKQAQALRNNYATTIIDAEREKYEQFDTSLNDVDAVIWTQYQICSSIADMPSTKLLGTTLKGFNATGEFEENSYHETLKSIQTHFMTPLLDRHHLLLIYSEIVPKFKVAPFDITHVWKPLDSTTAKGKAENNKLKMETDVGLVSSGILRPEEPRKRLATDPDSEYNGLLSDDIDLPDPEEFTDDPEINTPANEKETA